MPGAPFPCLNTIQPIFGCDAHKTIPPPPPAPPPFAPHVVVWGVGWSQKTGFMWAVATSKAASPESGKPKPVSAGWGYSIGRTHDSGPHPGHIWPNLLLPLILLGSGSKHVFGSGTVKVPGGWDKAVGVAWVMDLGLDCFDFPIPPGPSGLAISGTNSVRAGYSGASARPGQPAGLCDTSNGQALISAGVMRSSVVSQQATDDTSQKAKNDAV